MSNNYFNWPASLARVLRFTTVKAEDANGALDELSSGLDLLQDDVNRALKLPGGTADQVITLTSGQRAGLLVGFDADGNVRAVAAGFRWRGDWVTATLYFVNDTFRDPVTLNIYTVAVQHTSGVLADDIANGLDLLGVNVSDITAAVAAAQGYATAAASSAGVAAAQAGSAADEASSAAASASTAAAQVPLAVQQVALATTQAGLASTNGAAQVALAAGQVSLATTQAGIATAQAGLAAAAYDSFDDRYLGPKASDPSTDNDGNALVVGALYFNTTVVPGEMRVWGGTSWIASYLPSAIYASIAFVKGRIARPAFLTGDI